MAFEDYLTDDDDGTTSGSSSMATVERAPWALNAKSYIGSGDLYDPQFRDPRSGYWTMQVPGSERGANATWAALPVDTRKQINSLAKQYHYGSTGESLWRKAMAGSAELTKMGKPTTAFEWLSDYAAEFAGDRAPSSGPRGSGPSSSGAGYSGPTARVSYDNAPAFDVRALADAVSMEMLGRGVEQDEMERILKRVRKYENRNPSVSTSDNGSPVMTGRTSGGATNAGRQEVIERMLAKNPEFGDYQAATTVMGWFDSWLDKRGQAVG